MSGHVDTEQVLDSSRAIWGKIVTDNNICFVSEHARTSLLWLLMKSKLETYLPHETNILITLTFSIFLRACYKRCDVHD